MLQYFILVPIILGILISYEDFKKGIIKNIYIIILLLFGVFFQLLVYGFSFQIVPRIIYCLIISFGLWWLGMWPAGDAKFFTVLMLFFPPNLITNKSIIFDFLVNCFVPIFCFYIFFLVYRSRTDILKNALKFSFNPYTLFFIFIMFIGFLWVFGIFLNIFNIPLDFFSSLFIVFFGFEILHALSGPRTEIAFTFMAIIRIILDYKTVFTLNFILNITLSILVFIFFRFFILYLGFRLYTKEIKIENLKHGMILAENIYKKGRKYHKLSTLTMSFVEIMSQKKYKFIHSLNYLKTKDVKKIKKLLKRKKFSFDTILINEKQHFAFFIFLGFLITLLIKTNFISYIYSLI